MKNRRTGEYVPPREVRALLLRSRREHDDAAIANMRQAQVHLERAHAIARQLETLGGRSDGR